MTEKNKKASIPGNRKEIQRKRENTQAREKFGRVAIRMGFVNEEQVNKALEIQRKMDDLGQPHKLIGLIMLEEAMLSNAQLIEILKYFEIKREKNGQ
ncbi:MAG: hypothetical protein ACYS8W_08160 [Planctomycetota bacterium]